MTTRMDVAFVSNVVYPYVTGGAQKRIHEIGRRLADEGHTVTVYGRHLWDGPAEITNEGMTLRGVSGERELYTGDRRSITEAIEFSVALARPLRRHGQTHDVVVASVFPYFPVLTAKTDTLFRDTPLVTTWHEVWGRYWETYLGRLAPFGKAVERLVARVPQHPIAVSGMTADRLAAIGPPRERISVVPNGIDVAQIREVPRAEDAFDVVFAGRHIPEKNVDVLLRAFDRVAEDHDATLGIIGEGPETDRLRRNARETEAADRITFLGFLEDYEDVLGHLRAAPVFASASVREGFAIACLEAMAADCTVVAAAHPDSAASEVVGDAGFLPEPTVDAFAEALDRALGGERPQTDPVEAAAQYDWDVVVERAEGVYRDAIHKA
jgi:glycosyltransferase involved in cell wall biosynthesis